MLLEVLQLLVDVRDDGVRARGPVSRADLTVLVVELEGLDKTQNFFDVTANGGLVHGDLTESLVLVVANNEQTSQSVTSVLVQNTVGLRNLVVDVSEERVVNTTETTLLARSVDPSSVSVRRINGDTNNFGTNLAELFSLLAESNNFGGADESEVKRIEVENEVLALVVLQGDLLELAVDNSLAFEVRSGVADSGVRSQRRHSVSLFRRVVVCRAKLSVVRYFIVGIAVLMTTTTVCVYCSNAI
jgi:hypothetical protein